MNNIIIFFLIFLAASLIALKIFLTGSFIGSPTTTEKMYTGSHYGTDATYFDIIDPQDLAEFIAKKL